MFWCKKINIFFCLNKSGRDREGKEIVVSQTITESNECCFNYITEESQRGWEDKVRGL